MRWAARIAVSVSSSIRIANSSPGHASFGVDQHHRDLDDTVPPPPG
jgi:hypothetical protein